MKTFLKKCAGYCVLGLGICFGSNGSAVMFMVGAATIVGGWTGPVSLGDLFFEAVGLLSISAMLIGFGGKVIEEAWDEEWEAEKDNLAL